MDVAYSVSDPRWAGSGHFLRRGIAPSLDGVVAGVLGHYSSPWGDFFVQDFFLGHFTTFHGIEKNRGEILVI